MNLAGMTYDYDELIHRSEEINTFAINLDKHLNILSNYFKRMSNNLNTEQSREVFKTLERINSKSSEIQEALIAFSLSIHDDVAPSYKEIEKQAQEKAESYYG